MRASNRVSHGLVLQVVSSDALAGTERHVIGLTEALRGIGCDARILSRPGAHAVQAEARRRSIPEITPVAAWRNAKVVHAHDGVSSAAASLFVVSRDAVFVRSQHFLEPGSATRRKRLGQLSLAVHRQINRRVDQYVAVSEAARFAALSRGDIDDARVVVVPSGIHVAPEGNVASARAWRRRASSCPTVVSAGRLEAERRFDVLLRAVPLVLRESGRCRFVVAGDGSHADALRGLAAKLSVDRYITWTGWLDDIGPALEQAHIYVNTWPHEGFGMATAEAMSYELPAIVTSSGAAAELVSDGVSGRVIPPDDHVALAQAILGLLSNPVSAQRLGERARCQAHDYSIHRSATAMLAVYDAARRSRAARPTKQR